MTEFLLRNTLNFVSILAVATLVYVLVKWKTLPFLQRMTGLQFFFIALHIWEELRYPGGQIEMIEAKLHFTLLDPHFGELVLAAIVLITFIPPLLFPRRTFLVMVPMLLGLLELVAHSLAPMMFDTGVPYAPGLATAVLLLFPVSVISIRYAVRNKLMRPRDWLFSFLYMLFGLMVAQQIVIRSSGMNYFEFLANVRKSILGN